MEKRKKKKERKRCSECAFSLVMLGPKEMVFLVFCFTSESSGLSLSLIFFFFFLIIQIVCFDCSYFTTVTLTRGGVTEFLPLTSSKLKICLSAKALSMRSYVLMFANYYDSKFA